MCRGATRMKRRFPNPRYDDHKTTLSNSNSQDPSTRTPKPCKVGDAQPVDMRRQTSTKNPSDRELTPGVLSGKWHPNTIILRETVNYAVNPFLGCHEVPCPTAGVGMPLNLDGSVQRIRMPTQGRWAWHAT